MANLLLAAPSPVVPNADHQAVGGYRPGFQFDAAAFPQRFDPVLDRIFHNRLQDKFGHFLTLESGFDPDLIGQPFSKTKTVNFQKQSGLIDFRLKRRKLSSLDAVSKHAGLGLADAANLFIPFDGSQRVDHAESVV